MPEWFEKQERRPLHASRIEVYALIGDLETDDVGLLSEEYDAKSRRMLDNFPQAFSHIALAHAVFMLAGQWKPESYSPGL